MKKILMVCLISLGIISVAQAKGKLSIEDDEVIAEEQKKVEKTKGEIKKACGCAPEMDIQWLKLADSGTDEWRERTMQTASACLEQLSYAVGEMGKICVKYNKKFCAGINKISVIPGLKPSTTIKGKTLTLVSGDGQGCEGNGTITDVIKKNL